MSSNEVLLYYAGSVRGGAKLEPAATGWRHPVLADGEHGSHTSRLASDCKDGGAVTDRPKIRTAIVEIVSECSIEHRLQDQIDALHRQAVYHLA